MWRFLGFALIGIALMAVLAAVLLRVAAYKIRSMGRHEVPRPSDAAIVLGAYTDGFRPSRALLARLRAALHLFRQGYVGAVIVSGGRGEDETVTESSSMRRFLILNGVPSEVILEDRYSRDTWENLRNSRHVMSDHGLRSAVIVTSDYHLPRALAVAQQLDMQVSGFAAWSSKSEIRYAYREVIARIKYTLTGQAAL
ncbi:YdcF family protein [Alicyclobacillus sp. ALC3]|uniref:YdcF family protein n=1 Tax=Alicyclobacillus sp. ALC3 TaxID=2796143 RepID=UPI0023783921|nr:YdcF family protein [Alicyclobacillus sp. ALC3]